MRQPPGFWASYLYKAPLDVPIGALDQGAGVLWLRFRKLSKPVPRERRIVPIRITSRDKNGQESAIFNTGQRSSNALRLPWIETNWNGTVRFKCLLCQLVCYWVLGLFVCLFLASHKLQFETPYPLKQFSSLDVISGIITRVSECGNNKIKLHSSVWWKFSWFSQIKNLWGEKLYNIPKERGKVGRIENVMRSIKRHLSLMPTFTLSFHLEWRQIKYDLYLCAKF